MLYLVDVKVVREVKEGETRRPFMLDIVTKLDRNVGASEFASASAMIGHKRNVKMSSVMNNNCPTKLICASVGNNKKGPHWHKRTRATSLHYASSIRQENKFE